MELAPGQLDIMHGCFWKEPPHSTVAVRPVRPMAYYRAAIRDLARLARPRNPAGGTPPPFVIAGSNINSMLDSNDLLDAEYLEAQVLDQLELR